MERRFVVGAALLGAFLVLVTPIVAQPAAGQDATLEELFRVARGELKARRDSALKAMVQLDDAESKKFWPLVQAYDAEQAKIGEQRLALMTEFGKVADKLTDEQARQFSERAFALDDERSALRRKYFERIAQEISPVVAVQFLQLQRQFETMGDLKAASVAPLALR